jgi:hypothetical protein
LWPETVFRGGFYDPSKLPPDLLGEFHRAGLRDGYRGAEYSTTQAFECMALIDAAAHLRDPLKRGAGRLIAHVFTGTKHG